MTEDLLNQTVGDSSYELHEEYVPYPGTLVRIEPAEGKFGGQLKWITVLDADKGRGEDGADRETWAFSGEKITTHEKNKGRKYFEGITGTKVEKGQAIDLRALFGTRVQVLFEHYDGTDGKKDRVFAFKAGA